ncbi:MAG: hypothetical protein NZ693_02260 [Thermoflexales bacterium]|nr:hypothetical protein [Thermoflexales bacterium]
MSEVSHADTLSPLEEGRNSSAIATGNGHTCALRGAQLFCWGQNDYGQVGDGSLTNRPSPVPILSSVSAVAANWYHTCAIRNGGAYCWGRNQIGQLGDGTTITKTTPVAVIGMSDGVQVIATGGYHSCAIRAGALWCWGNNAGGQLGDSTFTDRSQPVAVQGMSSGVVAVTGGGYHTCAIRDGALFCWGDNAYGQLGDGAFNKRNTPGLVPGMDSGVVAVAAGWYHTCAIKVGGALFCWGRNGFGQIGDGTTITATTPVAVQGMGSGVRTVAGGEGFTCAIKTDGAVFCWGRNSHGQLGTGNSNNSTTPVAVSAPLNANTLGVALGDFHVVGIRLGGCLHTWGANFSGQLGLGTTGGQQNTPQQVGACDWGYRLTIPAVRRS